MQAYKWLALQKGVLQLFRIVNFGESYISPQVFRLSFSYYTKYKCYVRGILRSSFIKFQTKFTSQVTGFQICAIGISKKNPFCRACHYFIKSIWSFLLINFSLFPPHCTITGPATILLVIVLVNKECWLFHGWDGISIDLALLPLLAWGFWNSRKPSII